MISISLQKSFEKEIQSDLTGFFFSFVLLRHTAVPDDQQRYSVENYKSEVFVLIVDLDRLKIEVNKDGLDTYLDKLIDR